ncbi:unnamed protein product, partial [Mesorhabditis belari]|uniref:Uncharacterized protein n=1 Tax=Mesorhabditis belari TaxID=2138241 RepID=A0AAF3F9D3_9BILA
MPPLDENMKRRFRIYILGMTAAIAVLHDGAVIGGRMSKDNVVTVATDLSAAQFWAEVRKVEDGLGIPFLKESPCSYNRPLTSGGF